jgi:hypothetical protein
MNSHYSPYFLQEPSPQPNNKIIISLIVIFVIFVLFILIKMDIIQISSTNYPSFISSVSSTSSPSSASSASSASSTSSPSSASSASSASSPSSANQNSSTNCIVSDWSDCVNSKRTRTITQPTNGGINCTPAQNALPLIEYCNYVTIYPEPNYQGTGVIYYPPYSYNISESNNINSIKVPSGLRATLYDDENWNGASLVLTSDEPNLNNRGFNNIVSSIIIQSDNDCRVDYSPCVNGLTTKKITPATKDGIACSSVQNNLPLTKKCNDCQVNYLACINGISKKIIRPASNGGIACTPDQNALPLTKSCNGCEDTSWTSCENGQITKIITGSTNNRACPPLTPAQNAQLRTSEYCRNCRVSDWSECNPITKIRYRNIIQANENGSDCTQSENALPLTEPCINDLYVTVYSEPNYQGKSAKLDHGKVYDMNTLKLLGIDDNIINSIKVPLGLSATLLYNHNERATLEISYDEPNLKTFNFLNIVIYIIINKI